METLLPLGGAIVAALYFWLIFYGSRQRWMRGQTNIWAGASLAGMPVLLFVTFASIAMASTLWVIATVLMFVTEIIAFSSWDSALRYNRRWSE